MKKTLLAVSALLLVIGVFRTDASAQGMLGKRYMDVSLGQLYLGEDQANKVDDGVMVVGIDANVPVMKNLDLSVSGSYNKVEGFDSGTLVFTQKTREVWGGATVHFMPETAIDPFVKVSVGYVGYDRELPDSSQAAAKGFEDIFDYEKDGKDNNFAFGLGVGADIPFAGAFSARPAVAYKMVDDQDDFGAMIDFNGWFNKNFFAGLNIAYWSDKGDLTYGTSLGFAF